MTAPHDWQTLEDLFPVRRYVALTRREAVELGSESLQTWDDTPEDVRLVSFVDYAAMLLDAARWRRLSRVVANLGLAFGFVGGTLICVVIFAALTRLLA